ncbi:NUDIX domain-containing protein [Fulvivirga lutea]|uniref:NUDIX hydrolase n=1 Tax=Fulvivirga lutea TaxID=2810512 RepID=A0A974ZZT5_9BACT|nr:NUDIX hydrolase [Fulvivirga lutea]QSE96501.1 NUDIX hydrolase [Fulvivirga lutea]
MATQNIKLTVDAVIFGYHSGQGISVLLVERKYEPFAKRWAIPGGFVKDTEPLEEAASRELQEETGIKVKDLEQVYAFGEPNRDPRQRTVSVAYFGLVRADDHPLKAATDAKQAKWFDINDLPELAFDHHAILDKALKKLKASDLL